MQETEVKLELTQSGASSLLKKELFDGSPTIVQQKSVYFDTSGRDLDKRGLSLRIRQCGNERVQTVTSSDGPPGSSAQEKWQRSVADDIPVLDDPRIEVPLSSNERKPQAGVRDSCQETSLERDGRRCHDRSRFGHRKGRCRGSGGTALRNRA
ncbi:CYTH domain-containing protein [Sinorhizobium fredii]|uniref:CYTH domain-containing protein n=1 Tax=Rhizobium fredii TaxID=380 RepID=UPI0035136952